MELAIPTLLAALVAMAPGLVVLAALGVRGGWAMCASPAVTLALLGVSGIVDAKLGIPSSALTALVVPAALVIAAAVLVRLVRGERGANLLPQSIEARGEATMTPAMMALYVVVGLGVGYFMFVSLMHNYESLESGRDIAHHLNGVWAFAESGNFSSLSMSLYLTEADQAINPIGAGFYPSAWYALCAVLVQTGAMNAATAMNAVNYVMSSVAWPLSVLALMSWAFPRSRRIVACGSVACVSFMGFPWRLLDFGPIFPALASFALVPVAAWTFVRILDPGLDGPDLMRRVAVFLIAMVGVALTQTSAVFIVALLLIPCVAGVILRREGGWQVRGRDVPAAAVAILWLAFCAVCWVGINRLPLMRSVVDFDQWEYNVSLWQALVNVATVAYTFPGNPEIPQPVPAILVLLGLVWMLRNRSNRWVGVAYLMALVIVMGNSTLSGLPRHILSGFWYGDANRVAAIASMFACPVAAIGLSWVVEGFQRLMRAEGAWDSGLRPAACAAAGVAIVSVLSFFPSFFMPQSGVWLAHYPSQLRTETRVEQVRLEMRSVYNDAYTVSVRRRGFLRVCQERIAEEGDADAVVINIPNDGSFMGYGDAGMRMYYREISVPMPSPGTDAWLIRQRLDQIATDEEVRAAVERVGAKYVVMLDDEATNAHNPFKWGYQRDAWEGIANITPETPGFEVVMRQRDMVLYRIVGV